MFAPVRQLRSLPIAAAPARPVSLEAIGILCVFVLAGLIWLAIGGLVMRSGPAAAQ